MSAAAASVQDPRPASDGAPVLAEGIYPARVAGISAFESAHGRRIGFAFELDSAGGRIIETSAAVSAAIDSKLANLLRGVLGRSPTPAELAQQRFTHLVGARVRLMIRHAVNGQRIRYAAVAAVMRELD